MPALEVDLPEREERDKEDECDEDHRHPGRGPTNDITFCEREVEGQKGGGDERSAEPVHRRGLVLANAAV
ncbi:hypothetical protein J3459_019242 [Metarhizium acridum]|nr:hypothetical protein J3459_019242 [Metarhizium acridum]